MGVAVADVAGDYELAGRNAVGGIDLVIGRLIQAEKEIRDNLLAGRSIAPVGLVSVAVPDDVDVWRTHYGAAVVANRGGLGSGGTRGWSAALMRIHFVEDDLRLAGSHGLGL